MDVEVMEALLDEISIAAEDGELAEIEYARVTEDGELEIHTTQLTSQEIEEIWEYEPQNIREILEGMMEDLGFDFELVLVETGENIVTATIDRDRLVLEEKSEEQTMIRQTAVFVRKASSIDDLYGVMNNRNGEVEVVIEDTIFLHSAEWNRIANDLLVNLPLVTENKDKMFIDSEGVWHCIALVSSVDSDGVLLINSEGYDYPRYTAIWS